MGLGSIKTAWQRQTLKFGHDEGEKYSSLIFDNRGMGGSDKPIMRYSTSDMAKDVIELLGHLGWTEERQLHVTGVSMGGMIAQELVSAHFPLFWVWVWLRGEVWLTIWKAYQIPTRIASLNLLSTAAAIENTTSFVENLRTRINMFIPKSLDRSITDAARSLFADTWLEKRDDCPIPTASTPNVVLRTDAAGAPRAYKTFNTNFERFAAQELSKRLDTASFTKQGFMLQAIAAGWHHKSAQQLKEIGDKVGRERIMVVHGTNDNMITVPHGRKLIEMLEPGKAVIKEGMGHVAMIEEERMHNELVEQQIEKVRKYDKNNGVKV